MTHESAVRPFQRLRQWGRGWLCLALAVGAAAASAQQAPAGALAGPLTGPVAALVSTDPDTSASARAALRVEGVGADGLDVRPGTVCTVVFRVTNPGAQERTVGAALDVAPGWESVLPLGSFRLAGGGHDLRLVSVRVPPDAAPGTYRIRYRVSDSGAPAGGTASVTVPITVPAVRGLVLEEEDAPALATAGTPYAVRLLAVNTGNTPVAVVLEAASNLAAPLWLDSSRVWLRPGELRRLTVTASPGRDLSARVRHVVRVRAHVEGADETTAALAVVTEIVPPAGEASEQTALDAQVAVRGVRTEGRSVGQLDASGSAPLFGGTVEGAVTLADRERASVYGDRSRYSLRYAADGLAVVAGDQVFELSPLTDPGRFGFGVGAQVEGETVRAGAFYHRPRYGFASGAYGGAFAGLRVAPGAEVRANVLHQRGVERGDAVTFQATLARSRTAALDAECGLGTSTVPAGGLARACSARLAIDRPWLSVHTSAVTAEPGFPGRSRDVREVSGSAVARAWGGARLEAALQDRQWGDTFGGLATRTYRVGVARAGGGGARPAQVGLYLGGRHLGSGLGGSLFDRRDVSVQLAASYALGRVGLRGTAEVGRAEDDVRGERGPFQRVHARARLALGAGRSAHLGVEHRSGRTLYAVGEGWWRADAGAALGTARSRLSLSASASLDQVTPEAVRRWYAFAQLHAEHTLPFGHRIEVDGRRLTTAGAFATSTSEVRLSYVVPLRLTTASRSGGTVRGRVYDAETGRGLVGVAVTLGRHTALTDAGGVFVLPRPAEGTGYLRIDRVGAGIDRVPLREMPLAVPSGTDPAPDLEIPMLPGARLSGQFRVAADSASGGVPRAVLEIESAGRRLRAVADRDGRFAFEGVPPGDWTLRVLHAELPQHHAVERDAYAVSLAPGEHGHVEIGVRPRRRPIRLVERGTVVAAPAPGTPSHPADGDATPRPRR